MEWEAANATVKIANLKSAIVALNKLEPPKWKQLNIVECTLFYADEILLLNI